jgi:hypothetical protein
MMFSPLRFALSAKPPPPRRRAQGVSTLQAAARSRSTAAQRRLGV